MEVVVPMHQCNRWSSEQSFDATACWVKSLQTMKWSAHQAELDTFCEQRMYSRWLVTLLHMCLGEIEEVISLELKMADERVGVPALDKIKGWKSKVLFRRLDTGRWVPASTKKWLPGRYCAVLGRLSLKSGKRTVVVLYSNSWVLTEYTHSTSKALANLLDPDNACPDDPADAAALDRICAGEEEEQPLEQWLLEGFKAREVVRDDARAESGETEFQVQSTLRVAWHRDQRADPELSSMFQRKAEGFQVNPDDGVLERAVILDDKETRWVPVVPKGHAGAHVSWQRWVFLQCHAGLLGARSHEATGVVEGHGK